MVRKCGSLPTVIPGHSKQVEVKKKRAPQSYSSKELNSAKNSSEPRDPELQMRMQPFISALS